MANDTFIPFRERPAALDYGNTGRSYTCPAGKYARVVVTLTACTYGASLSYDVSGGLTNRLSDSAVDSKVIEVKLDTGDTLSVSTSAASNSGSGSTTATHIYNDGTSSATLTVNSQTVGMAKASIRLVDYITTAGTYNWDIDGTCEAYFHVEEYNI